MQSASATPQPPIDFTRVQLVAESLQGKVALFLMFFNMTQRLFDALDDHVTHADNTAWARAAHSLKGAAGNLGMTQLETLCRQAEAGANMTSQERAAMLNALRGELRRVKGYIALHYPELALSIFKEGP